MYKIVRITDHNNVDKNEPEVVGRIGRVIDDVQSSIPVGAQGLLWCVIPGVEKSIVTSRILKSRWKDNTLTIETVNSIYHLIKIDKYREDK